VWTGSWLNPRKAPFVDASPEGALFLNPVTSVAEDQGGGVGGPFQSLLATLSRCFWRGPSLKTQVSRATTVSYKP
jgi:hypothetical protein